MAIEVYEGLYSGSQIDAAIADVGILNGLVPTGASSSNKLATASDITGITDKIPSGASSSNKMATASDISSITEKIPASASANNQMATASDITGITDKIPSGASSSNKMATASDITGITNLIPAEATTTNKLADKAFVNSSVGTNTANYISNNGEPFASVADLEAYSGTVTNNDYAFVTGTDSAGNTYYDRYKATVSGSTVTWAKEYRLNNSSFTSTQWDAINSGITSSIIPSGASSSNKLATMSDIPSTSGIAGVQINSVDITPDANDKVNIPVASTSALGVIKTSTRLCTDVITDYEYTFYDSLYDEDVTIDENTSAYVYVQNDYHLAGPIYLLADYWQDNTFYAWGYDGDYHIITRTVAGTNVLAARYTGDYNQLSVNAFIGKGTLEQALINKHINDVVNETWTFTVDDGQGGTTTVTKVIKVQASS